METAAQIFARSVSQVAPEIQSRDWEFVETSIRNREYVGPDGTSAFDGYVFPEVV